MSCKSITLNALNASCSNSVGGIQVVYLLPYDKLQSAVVDTESDESASTYNMITGFTYAGDATVATAGWVEYKFRKNSGSMTSNLTIDETNGVSYIETDLVMLFSRMETKKRTEMVALAKGEVACLVKDSNGAYWFLGYNEGVTANAGVGQTGQQKTDGNYYQVTLRDSSDEYPFEVTEAAALAVIEAAEKEA